MRAFHFLKKRGMGSRSEIEISEDVCRSTPAAFRLHATLNAIAADGLAEVASILRTAAVQCVALRASNHDSVHVVCAGNIGVSPLMSEASSLFEALCMKFENTSIRPLEGLNDATLHPRWHIISEEEQNPRPSIAAASAHPDSGSILYDDIIR